VSEPAAAPQPGALGATRRNAAVRRRVCAFPAGQPQRLRIRRSAGVSKRRPELPESADTRPGPRRQRLGRRSIAPATPCRRSASGPMMLNCEPVNCHRAPLPGARIRAVDHARGQSGPLRPGPASSTESGTPSEPGTTVVGPRRPTSTGSAGSSSSTTSGTLPRWAQPRSRHSCPRSPYGTRSPPQPRTRHSARCSSCSERCSGWTCRGSTMSCGPSAPSTCPWSSPARRPGRSCSN
jgi:hypothetical protein